MISDDNYYDHYKDSFEQQKKYLTKRDHYTIAILVMVVVLCLQTSDANIIKKGVNGIIQKETNSTIVIDFKYICVSLSYIYLWLIMQYYQICLTIEKTYSYIQEIEEKISKEGKFVINREGVNYLKSYPWLKWTTHRIYVIIFPILFIFIPLVIAKSQIIDLCKNGFSSLTTLSIIANSISVIVSLLYISNRWFHEEIFSKDLYPKLHFLQRVRFYFHISKDKFKNANP